MTVQVSTRSWQHIDTIYGLWHCVHLVYARLATLISYTYVRLIDTPLLASGPPPPGLPKAFLLMTRPAHFRSRDMAAPNSSAGDEKTSVEFRETGLRCSVPRFHNGGNQLQSPAPLSPSPWMDHNQLLLACAHGRDIVQVIRSVDVSSVLCFQATGKPGPMAGVDNIRHSLHFSSHNHDQWYSVTHFP